MPKRNEDYDLLESYGKQILLYEKLRDVQETLIKLEQKHRKKLSKWLHEAWNNDAKRYRKYHKSFNYRLRKWLFFNVPGARKFVSLYPDYIS